MKGARLTHQHCLLWEVFFSVFFALWISDCTPRASLRFTIPGTHCSGPNHHPAPLSPIEFFGVRNAIIPSPEPSVEVGEVARRRTLFIKYNLYPAYQPVSGYRPPRPGDMTKLGHVRKELERAAGKGCWNCHGKSFWFLEPLTLRNFGGNGEAKYLEGISRGDVERES